MAYSSLTCHFCATLSMGSVRPVEATGSATGELRGIGAGAWGALHGSITHINRRYVNGSKFQMNPLPIGLQTATKRPIGARN